MEIEGEDGSTTQLKEGSEVVFGRGNGFNSNDPTVSRRHILFQLKPPRVSFQAIGKNPIWVRAKESGAIKAFRRLERGELSDGDLFCVSSNDPVWFSIKVDDDETEIMPSSSEEEMKLGNELELELSSESKLTGNVQDLDLGYDSIDVSNTDPVREFGFLVIGHEFDNYPKGKIRDVKSWNWFLEDYREASTDDEDDTNHAKGKKKALSRKRKKKNDKDDEEWTGESEEEETIAKSAGLNAPKYSIRSKDLRKGKRKKDLSTQKGSVQKRSKRVDEEEEEDEEEEGDETLGGFIVGDDDVEGEDEDDDEEDEFDEDECEE